MPIPDMRQFVFRGIYDMAALVEACVKDASTLIELDWKAPRVLDCLRKYSKITILHYYICAMISVERRRDYCKNRELYEDKESIADVEAALSAYGIAHVPFATFSPGQLEDDGEGERFYQWFQSEEESFELLWERMTEEVFHLLFANRAFLVQFNESVATYLQSGVVTIPTDYLNQKGVVKRQSHMPPWAKHAVYCRDHGRCVSCQKDLSGLLSTDRRAHYDHIVPLNLWGTNDPCNLQLLCDDCNLRKGGRSSQSGFRYPQWWDY